MRGAQPALPAIRPSLEAAAGLGSDFVKLDRWHEQIGDPTYGDAILDRLIHNAYRIELRGPSIRPRLSTDGKSNTSNDLDEDIPDTHAIHSRAASTGKKD
jgi:hypothetical protein